MGNARLGFLARFYLKAIVGVTLFFSYSNFAFAKDNACSSIFAKLEIQAVRQSNTSKTTGATSLRGNPKLKIVTWNLFNLKIPEIEYPPGSAAEKNTPQNERMRFAKSEGALLMMKRVFDDMNADVYVLQEVFSKASLEYVVKKYLGDKYDVVLEKGNDERGINVGFLVRKSLGAEYELRSHKDLKYEQSYGVYEAGTPVFARDLPALYLRQKDGSNKRASEDPDLIVLGAHFKSKRPTDGDFESTNRREVEAETAAKIVKEIDNQFNGRVPILLAGDFNTSVSAPEAAPLRNAFQDSLGLMGDKLTPDQKVTHTFHPLIQVKGENRKFEGRVDGKQVDAQWLNAALASKLIKSYVYHYKDEAGREKTYEGRNGSTLIYPAYFKQRKKNPSDHMPIVAEYDLSK